MSFLQRLFGGHAEPPAKMVETTACPYCGTLLDPPPKQSRKCPACRESIVVRTRRADGAKLFLTAIDARAFDEQRKREAARNSALRHAQNIGATDGDFERAERELAAKWGNAGSPGDAFWLLANQTVIAAIKRTDWGRLSSTYWEQALYLLEEGKPHLNLQKEASRAELRRYATEYSEPAVGHYHLKVEILGKGCCDICEKNHGRVLSISDALETLPIPNEACEREWCNCCWTPVFE